MTPFPVLERVYDGRVTSPASTCMTEGPFRYIGVLVGRSPPAGPVNCAPLYQMIHWGRFRHQPDLKKISRSLKTYVLVESFLHSLTILILMISLGLPGIFTSKELPARPSI